MATLLTRLPFLLCFLLWTSIGTVARAADCPAVGAAPPAPQATFLRSYRVSFNSPARLAVGVSADVHIADPVTGRVVVRAPDGRVTRVQKGLGFPNSVAVDGQGRVYIGDAVNGSVAIYSPGWDLVSLLGQGEGEFLLPGDIAIHAPTGNVYVTDTDAHEVKVYDADGGPVRNFGGEGVGNGQFVNPTGIFVSGAEVLVADHGNERVQRLDLDGNYCASLFANSLNKPQGIWVDAQDRIYVADAFQGQVVVLDRSGAQIGTVGDFGGGRGQLRTPLDVVMDAAGRLFVSSANNGRVDIFGIDAYADAEQFVPATVRLTPAPLDRGHPGAVVTGLIEVPGYRLNNVIAGSVTANGVPTTSSALFIGDNDRNGVRDLLVNFDADALLATLPPAGEANVFVRGGMGAMGFEAVDVVTVVHSLPEDEGDADEDADGDGIGDAADLCADTAADEAVDANGCSVVQYCPLSGPSLGQRWKNRGAFVSCVARTANEFVKGGLMSRSQRDTLLRWAATAKANVVKAATVRNVPPFQHESVPAASAVSPAPSAAAPRSSSPAAVPQTGGFLNRVLGYLGYSVDQPRDKSEDEATAESAEDFSIPGGEHGGTYANPAEKTDDAIGELSPNPGALDSVTDESGEQDAAQPEAPSDTMDAQANADGDSDGIADYFDLCGDTVAGEAVDTNGCSIAQLCTCEDEETRGAKPARWRYLACVKEQAESFADLGLMSKRQAETVVNAASASSCGIEYESGRQRRAQKEASPDSVAANRGTPDESGENRGGKR